MKMGADASHPVKPGVSMMSLTFHEADRVTVLHLDSAGVSAVRQAIKETWLPGIQLEQSVCGSGWLYKLRSNPFTFSKSKTIRFQSRQMVIRILQRLQTVGYHVACSGSIGKKPDGGTLFFKRLPCNIQTTQFLCVSFHQTDVIQFMNLPPYLVEPIKELIRTWYLGIQKTDGPGQDNVLEFKLAGTPWWPSNSEQTIKSKMLLQSVFSLLYRYQWFYHININLKSYQDCLIFRHEPGMKTVKNHELCMVSFGQSDRLRLINTSDDIIEFIRRAVKVNWNPGRIQEERKFHGSHEFKISGNPWRSVGEESAKARFLMLRIFQEMFLRGWHFLAGFQLSRFSLDRVLLFEKREPINYPMFCIAPHDNDKFWLINLPTDFVSLFKHILTFRWPNGIMQETDLPFQFGTAYKLQLSGTPWSGGVRNYPIHARSFLCSIVEEFSKHGWQLMLCADLTSRINPDYANPLDVHSFWFIYNSTTAQLSAPVFISPVQLQHYGVSQLTEGYGITTPPVFNELPPTYSEAIGWSD